MSHPQAFICDAIRIPSGRYGGALSYIRTDARLVTTAVNQLHTLDGRYALCTMCIGVGQGIAMIIERA